VSKGFAEFSNIEATPRGTQSFLRDGELSTSHAIAMVTWVLQKPANGFWIPRARLAVGFGGSERIFSRGKGVAAVRHRSGSAASVASEIEILRAAYFSPSWTGISG
jgi:hypothetical protein